MTGQRFGDIDLRGFLDIDSSVPRGYALYGMLHALDQAFVQKGKDLYGQLEGVAGTSIGALLATAAIGQA